MKPKTNATGRNDNPVDIVSRVSGAVRTAARTGGYRLLTCLTKKELDHCVKADKEWGFNRCVSAEGVKKIDAAARALGLKNPHYAVLGHFVHRHRAGKPCEPHVRVLVCVPPGFSQDFVVIDMPTDFFEGLPKLWVSAAGYESMAWVLTPTG
jgi:hypothetical protein